MIIFYIKQGPEIYTEKGVRNKEIRRLNTIKNPKKIRVMKKRDKRNAIKEFKQWRKEHYFRKPFIVPVRCRYKREALFMEIIQQEVEKGEITCDIGANEGVVTLGMIDAGASKVYSIEPEAKNYLRLLRNINLNKLSKKIVPENMAFGNKTGLVSFYVGGHANWHSLHNNEEWHEEHGKKENVGKIEVIVSTINDYFKEIQEKPTFYKMDVEGSEEEILGNSIKYFKNLKKCKLLMEVHPMFYSNEGEKFASILKQMVNIGFNTKYVISGGWKDNEKIYEIPPPIIEMGYDKAKKIYKKCREKDGSVKYIRALIEGIKNEHMIQLASHLFNNKKAVRSIFLVKST